MKIPSTVYPKLIHAFYANLSYFTENEDGEIELNSYVKEWHIKLIVHIFFDILGIAINTHEVYITTDLKLCEYLEPYASPPSVVFQTMTSDARPTVGNIQTKDLKPNHTHRNQSTKPTKQPKSQNENTESEPTIKKTYIYFVIIF